MAFLDFFKKTSASEQALRRWLRDVFGVKPKDISFYSTALRHKSAAKNNYEKEKDSNERLEFLGDAIIDAVVADYLYRRHPNSEEGELTKMKSRIVSRSNLNGMARQMDIPNYLETDAQAAQSKVSISGNALEALFGAMYCDLGYEATSRSILMVLKRYADLNTLASEEADFKSRLYEAAHKMKVEISFNTRPIGGNGADKRFISEVYFDKQAAGTGEGTSKKKAEQQAALLAWQNLNLS